MAECVVHLVRDDDRTRRLCDGQRYDPPSPHVRYDRYRLCDECDRLTWPITLEEMRWTGGELLPLGCAPITVEDTDG